MVFFYLGLVWYALKCFGDALLRLLIPTSWWPRKSLRGKVVLITGSGAGIGRALALSFAQRGCRLVLWSTTQSTNEETAEQCRQLGAEAVAYTVDVSKPDLVYQTAAKVREHFGAVDIVVSNAGVGNDPTKDLFEIPDEQNSRIIDVNLKSLLWLVKAFLPAMMEQHSGHIVSIASVTSFMTIPGSAAVDYCATKFGTFGMMETLEHSLWFRGIYDVKFTTCFPAWVPTKLAEGIAGAGGWPVISASDCAEQVIQAVELERRFAFIPGREAWMFFFKGLLPWDLYSKLIISGFENPSSA